MKNPYSKELGQATRVAKNLTKKYNFALRSVLSSISSQFIRNADDEMILDGHISNLIAAAALAMRVKQSNRVVRAYQAHAKKR